MAQTGYNLLTSVFKRGIDNLDTKALDVEFFSEVYKNYGGPILDIGCGTGRVLLRMAKKGIEINGVFVFNVIRPNNIDELLKDSEDYSFMFEYQDNSDLDFIHQLFSKQIASNKINMSYKCQTLLKSFKKPHHITDGAFYYCVPIKGYRSQGGFF